MLPVAPKPQNTGNVTAENLNEDFFSTNTCFISNYSRLYKCTTPNLVFFSWTVTVAKFGKSVCRDLQPSYNIQSEDLVSWTAHKTVTQSFQTPLKVQKKKEDFYKLYNMLTALSTMHFTINTYVSKIISTKTKTNTKKVEWQGTTQFFFFNYDKSKLQCPQSSHIISLHSSENQHSAPVATVIGSAHTPTITQPAAMYNAFPCG